MSIQVILRIYQKILQVKSEFSKMVSYRVNIQSQLYFYMLVIMIASLKVCSEGHMEVVFRMFWEQGQLLILVSKWTKFLSNYKLGWKWVTRAESLSTVNSAHFQFHKSLFLQLTVLTDSIKGNLLSNTCSLIMTPQSQESFFHIN